MTAEEIEKLIKKSILENMTVQVSINAAPYTNGEYYNVNVNVEYDGEEINSYGDTIHIPKPE